MTQDLDAPFQERGGYHEENSYYRLPRIDRSIALNVEEIRDGWEKIYSLLIWLSLPLIPFVFLFSLLLNIALEEDAQDIEGSAGAGDFLVSMLPLILILTFFLGGRWFFWKLTVWRVLGNGIEVGPNQCPQLYRIVKEGSELLGLTSIPRTIILQGHGNFHLTVEKRLARRGLVVITSNVMDALSTRSSSRELMMLVGQQLGHIRAGHYRFWFLRHVIAKYVLFLYWAWWRRCQFTADKIGLMLAGDSGLFSSHLTTDIPLCLRRFDDGTA